LWIIEIKESLYVMFTLPEMMSTLLCKIMFKQQNFKNFFATSVGSLLGNAS
jgi:hypothetical protein